MTPPRPWSTQPITGAQHDAWMAQERQRTQYPTWVRSAEELAADCGCDWPGNHRGEASARKRLADTELRKILQ